MFDPFIDKRKLEELEDIANSDLKCEKLEDYSPQAMQGSVGRKIVGLDHVGPKADQRPEHQQACYQ